MKIKIPNNLTQKFARQLLILKKDSPNLMFGAGIVGVLTGTVLACRATLRVSNVLDVMKNDVDEVTKPHTEGTLNVFTESERIHPRRELASIYIRGSFEIAKVYAPAVIVTGFSVAALTGSHVTLTRRNAALTAAYAGLHKAYEEYRDRVRENLGVDKELEIYRGATTEKVKGELKQIASVDPNKLSPYARFFDESSACWEKDPELNHLFVLCQQNYANDLLTARGHVFLNEVYDMLGIDRSSAGQVVGWVLGPEGDNYVSFSVFEPPNARFVNGWERSVLLDFNVDGVVFDKIKEK
jgi:Family of unknown function (DUF6353)